MNMPLPTIKNHPMPVTVQRVRAGQEAAATTAAKKNGMDDLIFKVGNDTFVATGRGLAFAGLKEGGTVQTSAGAGRVVKIDNQVNTGWDAVKQAGWIAGGVEVVAFLAALALTKGPGDATVRGGFLLGGLIASAVVGVVSMPITALWAKMRHHEASLPSTVIE